MKWLPLPLPSHSASKTKINEIDFEPPLAFKSATTFLICFGLVLFLGDLLLAQITAANKRSEALNEEKSKSPVTQKLWTVEISKAKQNQKDGNFAAAKAALSKSLQIATEQMNALNISRSEVELAELSLMRPDFLSAESHFDNALIYFRLSEEDDKNLKSRILQGYTEVLKHTKQEDKLKSLQSEFELLNGKAKLL